MQEESVRYSPGTGGAGATPTTNDTGPHVDVDYLVSTVSRLARVPTQVDPGFDTLMEPDHPRLRHYVQDVVRPELHELGYRDLIDVPRNNLVVVVGSGRTDRGLLVQNYTVAQHHNLMADPLSGAVAWPVEHGIHEPAVFGQGVSQVKAHQGTMLAVLRMLREQRIELGGRLYWAVNNEGRSSHACSTAILGALPAKPTFGVVQHGTRLALSLGNRGRVDLDVHVRGRVTHSSRPDAGASAIEGAARVIERLRDLSWPDRHPDLGGRHAIVYKMRFEPMAPHTLPSDAFLTVDRRLLPGDDIEVARREVETVIGDLSPYTVDVRTGVHMLPSLVAREEPGVTALAAAHRAATGTAPTVVHGAGTFDAGGPTAAGVPTVMYGASGGDWPTGDDFVTVADLTTEARTLAGLILDYLA